MALEHVLRAYLDDAGTPVDINSTDQAIVAHLNARTENAPIDPNAVRRLLNRSDAWADIVIASREPLNDKLAIRVVTILNDEGATLSLGDPDVVTALTAMGPGQKNWITADDITAITALGAGQRTVGEANGMPVEIYEGNVQMAKGL